MSKKVHINGDVYAVGETIGTCLASVINAVSKVKTKVVVELESGQNYEIFERIIAPNKILSFFSLDGKYSKINNNFNPSVDSTMNEAEVLENEINNYAIDMPLNPDLSPTGQAEKRMIIKDLFITGKGSGIRCQGSYKSQFSNIDIYNMENGINLEFCLQAIIKDCEVHFKNKGLIVGIIGTARNSAQSNGTSINDSRLFAMRPPPASTRSPLTALEVNDSNLVKVDGLISEGWIVERAIHLNNINTTVISTNISRFHAENYLYTDAVIVGEGRWLPILILDEIYYAPSRHRLSTFMRVDYTGTASMVKIKNTYAFGYWKIIMNQHGTGDRIRNISCGFTFDGMSKQLVHDHIISAMFSGMPTNMFGVQTPDRLYKNSDVAVVPVKVQTTKKRLTKYWVSLKGKFSSKE
jgi:hypothetical protein